MPQQVFAYRQDGQWHVNKGRNHYGSYDTESEASAVLSRLEREAKKARFERKRQAALKDALAAIRRLEVKS